MDYDNGLALCLYNETGVNLPTFLFFVKSVIHQKALNYLQNLSNFPAIELKYSQFEFRKAQKQVISCSITWTLFFWIFYSVPIEASIFNWGSCNKNINTYAPCKKRGEHTHPLCARKFWQQKCYTITMLPYFFVLFQNMAMLSQQGPHRCHNKAHIAVV
jgi:hypothetical protein